MVQKRSFFHSRRAQVTIFMIVGLLLLFVAIFLIQLTSNIKKEQLTGQQEKVFGNLFQKEGLRIGVEDCFHDILQESIVLLGKQSRIWSDQPGGTLEFVEGVTGTIPLGTNTRIAYAITTEIYPPDQTIHENPYPCDPEHPTKPCPYIFPDSHYGFGEIQLRKDSIEKDLLAYTTAQIGPCVEELIKSKTSSKVIIQNGTLGLQIKLENDGINVQVKYPLTLKLGDEELFHIADFDFFYDSLFKSFLDTAVVFPLQWDQKFVEFAYDEKQLKSPLFEYKSWKNIIGEKCETVESKTYFKCQRKLFNEKFNNLDISLKKEEIKNGNGDYLFIFTLPSSNILDEPSGKYTYQFARQNRPPALDYITRSGCPEKGYDYLVIPGDPELGNIDIILNALDPDEDKEIKYSFKDIDQFNPTDQTELNKGHILISKEKLSSISLGTHTFTTIATDSHERNDYQTVRVLIDRPITTSFSINIPDYKFGTEQKPYSELFKDKTNYRISLEDPFFLSINLPEKSNLKDVTQSVLLSYENQDSAQDTWQKDLSFSGLKTFRSVLSTEKSNFDGLTEKEIQTPLLSLFKTLTNNGKLKISFSAAYCPDKNGNKNIIDSPSQEATIEVKECIPHYNLLHLNPYIIGDTTKKYQIIFDDKGQSTGKTDSNLNPFLAVHACCDPGTWTFKEKGFSCYTNPLLDCYRSALIEEQFEACDGKRGNVCGDGNKHYLFPNNNIKCGGDTSNCANKNINSLCKNVNAFEIVIDQNGKKGWCHGTQGCTDYCRDLPRVYIGKDIQINGKIDTNSKLIELLKTKEIITNTDLQLACGCNTNEGKICDGNLDGTFEGTCETNQCVKPTTP